MVEGYYVPPTVSGYIPIITNKRLLFITPPIWHKAPFNVFFSIKAFLFGAPNYLDKFRGKNDEETINNFKKIRKHIEFDKNNIDIYITRYFVDESIDFLIKTHDTDNEHAFYFYDALPDHHDYPARTLQNALLKCGAKRVEKKDLKESKKLKKIMKTKNVKKRTKRKEVKKKDGHRII